MHVFSFRSIYIFLQYRCVGIVEFIFVSVTSRIISHVVTTGIEYQTGQNNHFNDGIGAQLRFIMIYKLREHNQEEDQGVVLEAGEAYKTADEYRHH